MDLSRILRLAGALLCATAVLLLIEAPAGESQQPQRPPSVVDARATGAGPRQIDEAALARLGPKTRALPGTLSDGPRTLWRSDGALTGPSQRPAERIVRDFLRENGDVYGLGRAAAASLELASSHEQRGVTHLRFRQRVAGLEVFQGEIKAAVAADGSLIAVNGSLLADGGRRNVTLSAEEATSIGANALDGIAPAVPPIAEGPRGGDGLTTFEQGGYFRPPTAKLVWFATPAGGQAGWLIELPVDLSAWYQLVIDASNGDLLFRANISSDVGPEGEVFPASVPDPDDGGPVIVPFVGSLPAPRDEWIPPAGTTTQGNNVVAGEDRDGGASPAPAVSATQEFNFGFADAYETTSGADRDTDLATAITNVFYWNNFVHDYYYELGFTETAGNFQADNFGAGGVEGDPVLALVQYGADSCPLAFCYNNAFFATVPDGGFGFMFMLLLQPPQRYVDGALASDVIIHEYTHGLSNRLVGVNTLFGVQSGAMGEGWGDWFGASITDDPVVAEYWNADTVTGIRYFSMAANPSTYGDVCFIGYTGCEVHKEGEIWAATLWDVRTAMQTAYGAAPGRAKAEQLVMDGLMFTPPVPSFLEARDALLQADIASAGGDHCLIWSAFAARGMGDSAQSFGDSADVFEAFDLPFECLYPGPDSDGDTMPDSYETANIACLNPGVADGVGDPDTDTLLSTAEMALGTNPCGPSDTDGIGDAIDNCPLIDNAGQANNDRNFIDLPTKPYDDLTRANSDLAGDVCDLDDDNDGISDTGEAALPGDVCPSASAATSATNPDSDGDRVLDRAECIFSTDPNNPLSKPAAIVAPDADSDGLPDPFDPNSASFDSDGDFVRDGVEFRNYNTSPSLTNSDGDLCTDPKEVASINLDSVVNAIDLSQIAQSFSNSMSPSYIVDFDTNKDGVINSIDLSFVAQRFGAC